MPKQLPPRRKRVSQDTANGPLNMTRPWRKAPNPGWRSTEIFSARMFSPFRAPNRLIFRNARNASQQSFSLPQALGVDTYPERQLIMSVRACRLTCRRQLAVKWTASIYYRIRILTDFMIRAHCSISASSKAVTSAGGNSLGSTPAARSLFAISSLCSALAISPFNC